MDKICVINGPNLDLLGRRNPNVYGSLSLEEIQEYTQKSLSSWGDKVQWDWFQSSHEGEIIKKIHSLLDSTTKGLIINPGGYSHTSVAIFDALELLTIPVFEVHISNIYKRDGFRQTLLTAKASTVIMSGLGKDSYLLAAKAILLRNKE